MKFKCLRMKNAGVLVCALGLIGGSFAQTRTLMTPADSVSAGGKILSALDGVCTLTNNKCATIAGVGDAINNGVIAIPSQSGASGSYCGYATQKLVYPENAGDSSWTTYASCLGASPVGTGGSNAWSSFGAPQFACPSNHLLVTLSSTTQSYGNGSDETSVSIYYNTLACVAK